MANNLQGKTALVTGGGSGIGAAIAGELAKAGCRVVISGRNQNRLDTAAEAMAAEYPVKTCATDVSNEDAVETLFDFVEKEVGPVEILVNGAGINIPRRSISEMEKGDWEQLMSINVNGAFYCTRRALDGMRRKESGTIINISSASANRPWPLGGVGYNVSKAAMSALTISLREQERENGIRLTNICPGEVNTPIMEARPTPVSEEHRRTILQPEDVAAAVMMVVQLPPRAHIPELVIVPQKQSYV